MKTALVRIGNSRGIRIPKAIIEQCGFGDTVQKQPRQGWKEAFAAAGSDRTDSLFLDTLARNKFDSEEWTW
jgi:antitoxin MazE